MHTYIHTYMHTYTYTCIHTFIHTYIHTYMDTYIYTYMHTYIYIYMYQDSQNRNYGEVFCERIKAIIGPEPIAVTGSTEGWRRITNCTEWADWEQVTDEPYLEFCCNQLGNYVPNCPQL